ncbi:MAG: DUF2894 domain-containing protein [Polyangiales bacterium]
MDHAPDGSALERVERALDVLEAEGARQFDAPSCDCVRSLLTRAEELGGALGARLVARADDHVQRLGARFRRLRGETATQLAVLVRHTGPQPALEGALGRGDLVLARRGLRRIARLPEAARTPRDELAVPSGVHAYDDAHAELVAAFALARATDVVPKDAGPYNPLRIASDLLERMRTVSPLYLTAQLNRLEELASLLSLPELPEPPRPRKPLPRRKRTPRDA